MPIMRCTLGGRPGWKWGESGRCYTGANAKEKAIKQGISVFISEAKRSGAKTKKEIDAYVEKRSKTEI